MFPSHKYTFISKGENMSYNNNPSLFDPQTSTFVFTLNGNTYLGLGDDQRCIVVSDISEALRFRAYEHKGGTYYQVIGGYWDGYYLTASYYWQVSIEVWSNSISWEVSGGHLITRDMKSYPLYLQNQNGLLYLTDGTTDLLSVTQDWPWADYSNWMETLQTKLGDDFKNVPIFQLPIPGSHDSGTYGMSKEARTQNLTVADQLMLGIRFFDLRPRVYDGVYYIHHGILGSSNHLATFPPTTEPCIFTDIQNFLQKNTREVVFLKFQSFDGHGTDSFNPQDHIIFRRMLNGYFSLVTPASVSSITFNSLFGSGEMFGRVIVFYDNVGANAGGPGQGDSTWDNIWPYLTESDQLASSKYIKMWDPFWDDVSSSLANEGRDAQGHDVLTTLWKTYHLNNMLGWQDMKLSRFLVTQAQMQLAQPTGMGVNGYFSKVERSAVNNNPLNIALFTDWMTNGVPQTLDPGSARLQLRPNVLTLDFVEFGSLCENIINFFESLTPSDFKEQYKFSTSFIDAENYPTSGTFVLTLGQSQYVGVGSTLYSFAVPTSDKAQAIRFRMVMYDGRMFLMAVGGDIDSQHMTPNIMPPTGGMPIPISQVIWISWSSAVTAWQFINDKLLSLTFSKYVYIYGSTLYANADDQQALLVSLEWD